ncbi:MAG: synthase subunit delta [Herminiimonas sp.]|jgi:F-type H+-transporting ATPase subunit delta|nr:synthase subunit delta [Herminiimonas sp.]
MAELATIARPYAEALFRVAKSGNLSAWSDLVSEMAQVASHPDVHALAQNPKLSDQQIGETFMALLKSPLNDQVRNFIMMLVENGRMSLLPEIAVQFHALKNAEEGAADAEIFSAFDLSSDQVKQLVSVLEKKFGRKVNPSVTVDPSLIGGVRVVIGDEVYDTSVRARLQQMHVAMAA